MLRRVIFSLGLLTSTSVPQNAQLISLRSAGTYQSLPSPSVAQNARLHPSGFDPTYKLVFRNPVQDKNFYLLSLFQRNPEVGKLLRRNAVLKRLTSQKIQALRV